MGLNTPQICNSNRRLNTPKHILGGKERELMTHEDASGWISLILSKKITLVSLLLPYLN